MRCIFETKVQCWSRILSAVLKCLISRSFRNVPRTCCDSRRAASIPLSTRRPKARASARSSSFHSTRSHASSTMVSANHAFSHPFSPLTPLSFYNYSPPTPPPPTVISLLVTPPSKTKQARRTLSTKSKLNEKLLYPNGWLSVCWRWLVGDVRPRPFFVHARTRARSRS